MNPGACYFAFSNNSTVRIQCTSDISPSSTIPSELLSKTYFSKITTIDFGTAISALPRYLCSLPSREINLSYQAFTTLTNETFPCLDSFTKVTLAHNNLATVNMPTGNFSNLAYLDLSSNRLTIIPYSILKPTPSSLRYLDLRNNSITSIDLLFLSELKNITVDLRNNPVNNSANILNPQNITLPTMNNTNSTVIIIPPISTSNSTYIFNDQTALTAGSCNRDAVLAYRNIIRMIFSDVVLDCSCASINLKGIFQRIGLSITNSFNCSPGTTAANFATLTMSSCASTALNFTSGLCYNESLQVCWKPCKCFNQRKNPKDSDKNRLVQSENTDHIHLIVSMFLCCVMYLCYVLITIAFVVSLSNRLLSNKVLILKRHGYDDCVLLCCLNIFYRHRQMIQQWNI